MGRVKEGDMRYLIWGPVAGVVIASLLFLFGIFGTDANKFLIAAIVLVALGLIIGWYMDSQSQG